MNVTGPLVDAATVAQDLGIDAETVRAQARRGDLPGVRVGRLWRFDLAEVRAHLNQRREDPWAQPARSATRRRK